jgi:hypothetical protein
VCRRSTTTCATCRHFRRGIASGLGLCGLDPRHPALDGTEIRACWTAAEPQAPDGVLVGGSPVAAAVDRPPARTFVPVDELEARGAATVPATGLAAEAASGEVRLVPAGTPAAGPSNAWSLWGDADP